jgi:hypothetical protein
MLENLTDEETGAKEACYELISSMEYVKDDESPNGARPPRGNILPVNRFFSDWYPFVTSLFSDLEIPKAQKQSTWANSPKRNYEKLLKLLEEYVQRPKIGILRGLGRVEKTIWESIHNEFCAH